MGIAALGILALRSVTERQREIGMLRATWLTQQMILKAFRVEYSFVTLTGTAVGGLLGLLVVYDRVIGPGAASTNVTTLFFRWGNPILVRQITGVLATLAVIGPSLRAARLPPSEAIRGVECADCQGRMDFRRLVRGGKDQPGRPGAILCTRIDRGTRVLRAEAS